MKIEKHGSATHYYIEKGWKSLSEKEKEDIVQRFVGRLIVTKISDSMQDDIKTVFRTLADNDVDVPSAPFTVLDVILFYHNKLDRSERLDAETFNTALNYYCATLFQIGELLRKKDQTIESLMTALEAKNSDKQGED